tara:strand:+ start:7255 stop:7440 length:186 start_codon:yes stop_codon:yes gene_type:complete
MSKKQNLEEIRTLVNKLDNIAQEIKDILEELDYNNEEMSLLDQMDEIQEYVNNYQEAKGYI